MKAILGQKRNQRIKHSMISVCMEKNSPEGYAEVSEFFLKYFKNLFTKKVRNISMIHTHTPKWNFKIIL